MIFSKPGGYVIELLPDPFFIGDWSWSLWSGWPPTGTRLDGGNCRDLARATLAALACYDAQGVGADIDPI